MNNDFNEISLFLQFSTTLLDVFSWSKEHNQSICIYIYIWLSLTICILEWDFDMFQNSNNSINPYKLKICLNLKVNRKLMGKHYCLRDFNMVFFCRWINPKKVQQNIFLFQNRLRVVLGQITKSQISIKKKKNSVGMYINLSNSNDSFVRSVWYQFPCSEASIVSGELSIHTSIRKFWYQKVRAVRGHYT